MCNKMEVLLVDLPLHGMFFFFFLFFFVCMCAVCCKCYNCFVFILNCPLIMKLISSVSVSPGRTVYVCARTGIFRLPFLSVKYISDVHLCDICILSICTQIYASYVCHFNPANNNVNIVQYKSKTTI